MSRKWKTQRLGDLLEIQNGYAFDSRQFDALEGMPLIRIRDLKGGLETEARFKGEYERNYVVHAGDLLVGMDGEFGCFQWHGAPALLNQRVCRLEGFDSELEPRFLFYGLNSYLKAIEDVTGYTTVKHLSSKQILDIQFPLPPLAEQRRIVRILDDAMNRIAVATTYAERNLRNSRALFESHLQRVFSGREKGWVSSKLRAVTTKIGSGATPRGGEASYKSAGISLIRSLNVHDLGFKYAKLAFLDDAQADDLSNVEVQPRDVLLNITGASVARCCIVPGDILPARVNQHVSIIRPIASKIDPGFLHFLLISKPYKDQLLQTGAEGGSTRQAITKAQIQEFSVEYPAALREQEAIVSRLNTMLAKTQRLAALYERKLSALEALKRALLNEAFSGNL